MKPHSGREVITGMIFLVQERHRSREPDTRPGSGCTDTRKEWRSGEYASHTAGIRRRW